MHKCHAGDLEAAVDTAAVAAAVAATAAMAHAFAASVDGVLCEILWWSGRQAVPLLDGASCHSC
jgi:hypothetical protein